MATMLTSQSGRAPGIARARLWTRSPRVRMSPAQRAALAALIHTPPAAPQSRWERRDSSGDMVWVVVIALASFVGVLALADGVRVVNAVDALRARPLPRAEVTMVVTRVPAMAPEVAQQAAPVRQSSAPTIRTM